MTDRAGATDFFSGGRPASEIRDQLARARSSQATWKDRRNLTVEGVNAGRVRAAEAPAIYTV